MKNSWRKLIKLKNQSKLGADYFDFALLIEIHILGFQLACGLIALAPRRTRFMTVALIMERRTNWPIHKITEFTLNMLI